MLTVGITGGIGSGKTTVCKIFETIGIPVYYADSRAKYLMERDPDLLAALKNNFGTNIFLEDNMSVRSTKTESTNTCSSWDYMIIIIF